MEIHRQFVLLPVLYNFSSETINLFEYHFFIVDARLSDLFELKWGKLNNLIYIKPNSSIDSYLDQDPKYKHIHVLIPYQNDESNIHQYASHASCKMVIFSQRDYNELKFEFKNDEYQRLSPDDSLVVYERKNLEEHQYLLMISHAKSGVRKASRTGIYTLSVFGTMSRYSLRNGRFPLLTTKKVFWRAVVEELLWFLRGETSSKTLSDKGIKIWDGNGTKTFLESRGLGHREEGDLGPVYGFQWRHFGAKYVDCHTDYTGQGVDQINNILETLRTDPDSRRMVLTAWNPQALDEMALPPCHVMAVFNVLNGELNCMMTQRSADIGLGVPFNIASYALLTRILAYFTGLKAGDLVYATGDTHIYENHLEQLNIQMSRIPKQFPTLKIIADKALKPEELKIDNFILMDYDPYDNLPMPMAV